MNQNTISIIGIVAAIAIAAWDFDSRQSRWQSHWRPVGIVFVCNSRIFNPVGWPLFPHLSSRQKNISI